jgi:hypothetical protein
MHVLQRPHLPRLISASVAVFMLAIVKSKPFASLLSRPLPQPWFTPRG